MDHLLKPDKLDLDPQSPGATTTFEYWLACFKDFLSACAAVVPDDASKLRVLRSRVGPLAFSFIRDSVSYDAAILLLKAQYVKRPNVIFARHLLAIRKQLPGESNAEFLRALRLLARACNFQAVSAVDHADGMIRDSYVAGLRSPYIRQRLLETADLTLQRAVELADSLDVAIHDSAAYLPDQAPACVRPLTTQRLSRSCGLRATRRRRPPRRRLSAFFCGQSRHPRSRCPAKDAICSACAKKGHFAKVCRAKSTASNAAQDVWAPPASPDTRVRRMGCRHRRHLGELPRAHGKQPTPSLLPPPASSSGPASDLNAGYAESIDPLIAAITLDQDRPHGLDNSVAQVEIDGHATPCLFDSGSTESFIHPSTVRRYSLRVIPTTGRILLASKVLLGDGLRLLPGHLDRERHSI